MKYGKVRVWRGSVAAGLAAEPAAKPAAKPQYHIEGPPATYWPTDLVPLSEEEYNEIFVTPWKSSEYNARYDTSFHPAQAEAVPVQPTTSSDNASGGSRPDGTSATANSSSAQAGYAVAPGVAQVDRAISPPRVIP